jgi:hypothetical protein
MVAFLGAFVPFAKHPTEWQHRWSIALHGSIINNLLHGLSV